jgi:glycosyltransferase involved in cell wall biosynthesis
MQKTLISVLMPSYNHEKFIAEAIESVLNQTYSELELIIVDDGSIDDSVKIIKKFANSDNRIKYKSILKNQGAALTMQDCFKMASGSLIAVISSDDVWISDKLEKQVKFLNDNKQYGAVFSLAKFIDQDGKEIITKRSEFAKSLDNKSRYQWLNFFFKHRNCLCHPSILIRKECFDQCGFYDARLRSIPDLDMWVRLCFKHEIYIMNENLIKFRKHSHNESVNNDANFIRNRTEYRIILQHYARNILDIETLEKIFPEYLSHIKVKNDKLTLFYLARIAMERNDKFAKDFALDILYKIMEDAKMVELLKLHDLYDYIRLQEDTAESDIYNISKFGNFARDKSKIYLKIPMLLCIGRKRIFGSYNFVIQVFGFNLLQYNGKVLEFFGFSFNKETRI